jgi:hypothetical protein
MAIDQVTESVQRQERPLINLKNFKSLSIADDENSHLVNKCNVGGRVKTNMKPEKRIESASKSSNLLPPLKSPRYCKKQQLRNCKSRALTPHAMLMHETAINHHRISGVLNELGGLSEAAPSSLTDKFSGFWSKKHCQAFWNEYQKCETDQLVPTRQFSTLSLGDLETDWSGQARYTKISRSIRKLLKRTFTGAASFCELEQVIKAFSVNAAVVDFDFSCGQVLGITEFGATIKLDTPFHRVWLHAICQYYGLSSQSKTISDDRIVFVYFGKLDLLLSPKVTLYNFLSNL